MKIFVALAPVLLLAACVQPGYPPSPYPPQYGYSPGQPYPLVPAYRPPQAPPVPIPLPEPATEPAPSPAQTPPAQDDNGPIPLQDMPPPAPDASSPAPDAPPAPQAASPAPVVEKAPSSGAGSNVPLEGFRPMRGQTRPTP